MNKNILKKLMELDNPEVDLQLRKIANQIQSKILESKNNDKIFKELELLEEFVYKVPEQTIKIVNDILKNKKRNKSKIYKIQDIKYTGKGYEDLVSKCIELLNKICYLKVEEVFQILEFLCLTNNKKIKSESIETLNKLARYDFYALKNIGYSVQRKILDIILKWSEKKQIKNIEIIKITTKEFLKPSFEGVSMKDYKTIVFKSGVLQPTNFLKKIRRDTINLLFCLYKQVKDIKIKINLLEILYEASSLPHTANYGDDIAKMIVGDISYLLDIYQKIVLNKENKIIVDLPIVQEIERQLVWFNKNYKDKLPNISIFLNNLRGDEMYDLYRTMVGDTLRLDRIEKEEWGKAEEKIKEKIGSEFKKIKKENLEEWNIKLNLIAKYKDLVDEWKFSRFKGFLRRIAREKFELSKVILEDSFKKNKPLKVFTGCFLFGFIENRNLSIWDSYVEKIVKEKNINLVKDILNSFFYVDKSEKIRKKDVSLLSQIIKKEKQFDFLKRIQKNKLLNLNYFLIRVLVELYNKSDKKKIESLIITLIKEAKEEQHLFMFLRELGFPAYKNEIDLFKWDKKNIELILNKLVEVKDLSYENQLLLLAIARNHFLLAMNVFFERIKIREKMMEKGNKWIPSIEYDAIPYYFNDKLIEYINQKTESIKIIEGWMKKMTPKSSIYNIELAQFFQKIGGIVYDKVLSKIIRNGKASGLKTAVRLMWGINTPDIKLCLEIVKKTGDKDIWKTVGGLIFSTGVVHGEYGLSDAYKSTAERIKVYKTKGTQEEIKRVEKFKIKIIKSLQEAAKREEQSADEEIQLEKLKFRG